MKLRNFGRLVRILGPTFGFLGCVGIAFSMRNGTGFIGGILLGLAVLALFARIEQISDRVSQSDCTCSGSASGSDAPGV
jgi:hypothetical protein